MDTMRHLSFKTYMKTPQKLSIWSCSMTMCLQVFKRD